MAAERPFLVPVVVDDTGDQDAVVPDPFRAVQWTRLPAGDTPPEFATRIGRLLSPEPSSTPTAARPAGGVAAAGGSVPMPPTPPSPWLRRLPAAIAVVATLAVAYLLIDRLRTQRPVATTTPATAAGPATSPVGGAPATAAAPGVFTPPPHSIAVLPFVNMSGDKEQEYFSDGLTEELLNSLARINELQVAARTSAFSFKGKDVKIGAIAR